MSLVSDVENSNLVDVDLNRSGDRASVQSGSGNTKTVLRNFGSKRNLKLWDNFERIDDGSVKCVMCGSVLKTKDKSTTPMHTHLRAKHPEFAQEHENMAKKQRNVIDNNKDVIFKSSQPSRRKYSLNGEQQLRAEMEILLFLATTNQEFSLLDEPGFKRLVNHLSPRINVKRLTTFPKSKCARFHALVRKEVEKELKLELPDSLGVAFTCHYWTNQLDDMYQSICIHFINHQFKIKKLLLECKKLEGPAVINAIENDIASVVRSIPELKDDAFKIFVTESDRSINSDVVKNSLVCIDQIINGAVSRGFEVECLRDVIQLCKKLAKLCNESWRIRHKLATACGSFMQPIFYEKNTSPVSTNWKSLLLSLESIVAMKEVLEQRKADEEQSEFASLIPNEMQFEMLRDLVTSLVAIRNLSDVLYKDKQPTIHQVLPFIYNQNKIKARRADEIPVVRSFLDAYFEHFERHMPSGDDEILYFVGNFFHPFFKGALIDGRENGAALQRQTLHFILKDHHSYKQFHHSKKIEKAKATQDANVDSFSSTWNDLYMLGRRGIMNSLQHEHGRDKSAIEWEIVRYLEMPSFSLVDGSDALNWWKSAAKELPLLSQLARAYLSIPCTSALSDIVFSTSGNIFTSQEASLNPETIGQLVYINENSMEIEIREWNLKSDHEFFEDKSDRLEYCERADGF